jgi:hypothetical protein
MTEADDNVVELRNLDQLFENVLAGQVPGPEAPAWSADLARLVHGARVEAVPGELAGHDAIVASMLEVRREAAAGEDAGAHDHAAPPLQPIAEAATPPDVAEAAPAAAESVGGPRVPRHIRGERGYRAKHAAARTQASGNPTARHVGRLIALKAAAVTTAVVVGTVAAAAATTGIVANVVVPAFTSKAPDTPPASKTTTPQRPGGGGAGGDDDEDLDATVPVPACQLAPVCSPLTPAGPAPDDAAVPTTERPGTSTTTTEPPATTTTTEAPTTTEPQPTTTTTETPPTTQPEPVSTFSAPDAGALASR